MRAIAATLVTAVALSVTAPASTAADSPGIPKKALDAMKFFVGKWEGGSTVNGEEIAKENDERSWVPGKYCLTMKGSGIEKGARIQYSGICGWDAKGKQLVENWHASDGLSVVVRYPLKKMGVDAFEGRIKVTLGDGTVIQGKCRLDKTDDGFVFTSPADEEGKVRKGVSRRVK